MLCSLTSTLMWVPDQTGKQQEARVDYGSQLHPPVQLCEPQGGIEFKLRLGSYSFITWFTYYSEK